MLKKTVRALRGSVCVRVESAWPERILNLCAARHIELSEPQWLSATELRFSVSRRDFPAFRRLVGNAGADWHLERKAGMPYFLSRFRRRHVLLAGLVVLSALLIVNSLFIWDFAVTGNDTVPAEKILRVLAKNNVRRGTFAYSFRSQDICNRALPELPELAWLTINVRGCRADVVVRERRKMPELVNERTPTNVIARRSGLVTRVQTLDGEARVQKGTTVERGQLLITGVVETQGVEQPSVNTRFLAGKGEVWGRTWYEWTVKLPLSYEEKTYTAQEKHRNAIIWGEKRCKFQKDSSNIGANCDKIFHQTKWRLFGTFLLPITWETECLRPYETQTRTRSEQEAEAKGREILARALSETLEGFGSATSVQYSSQKQGSILLVTMRAECLEQIGETVTIPVD